MCGGSASTESDNCDGIEISKCECRIRDAVVPSHTNSSQKRRRELQTHLARVDLLAAEGVVVSTHLDEWRCADGGRLALSGCRKSWIAVMLLTQLWCGRSLKCDT